MHFEMSLPVADLLIVYAGIGLVIAVPTTVAVALGTRLGVYENAGRLPMWIVCAAMALASVAAWPWLVGSVFDDLRTLGSRARRARGPDPRVQHQQRRPTQGKGGA